MQGRYTPAVGGKHFSDRIETPTFLLGTWSCGHDHRGPGPEQEGTLATINVVTSGLFVRHVGRRSVVADPTVAVLSSPGEGWRTSHPTGCGDAGVYVLLQRDAEPLRRPAFAERLRPLRPAAWLDWVRAARSGDVELAYALVADVVDAAAPPLREPPFVRRARHLIAGRLSAPPSLEALAAEVRASPSHLCRTFRAVTGLTPRAYAERLRLASAARRIELGCVDLAALAHELGFASHSHLTARLRTTLGATPTALRARS